MKRAPYMQMILDKFSQEVFGKTNSGAVSNSVCVICHKYASEFRDGLSQKEYNISGMCQQCQDFVFSKGE